MATDVLPNSFADAAFSDRPPDGTDPGVTEPIPGVREPEPKPSAGDKTASDAAAKAAYDKASADAAAKEAAAKAEAEKGKLSDLDNPHLASKPDKKGEATEPPSEMPAELKKGMTEAAAKKAETAWKSILESEKKWKAEAETAKTTATKTQEELTGLKKQVEELASLKTELETAKKTLQGYENEMSVTRVEGTKEFKSQVTAPMAEITSTVDEIAKRYEVTPDSLLRVIQEPDRAKRTDAIDEAVSDFKHADQMEIVQAAKDYHRIQKVAAEMRENAGAKLKELTAAEKAAEDHAHSENVTEYSGHLDTAWKQLQDRIPYVRNVEGKEGWNGYLASRLREGHSVDVNNLPLARVASAVAAELVLPDVTKVAVHFETKWKEAEAKLADAEKKLEDRRKLSAGAGGGSSAGGDNGTAKKGGTFVDSVF
jgi:transposase-like protein